VINKLPTDFRLYQLKKAKRLAQLNMKLGYFIS